MGPCSNRYQKTNADNYMYTSFCRPLRGRFPRVTFLETHSSPNTCAKAINFHFGGHVYTLPAKTAHFKDLCPSATDATTTAQCPMRPPCTQLWAINSRIQIANSTVYMYWNQDCWQVQGGGAAHAAGTCGGGAAAVGPMHTHLATNCGAGRETAQSI